MGTEMSDPTEQDDTTGDNEVERVDPDSHDAVSEHGNATGNTVEGIPAWIFGVSALAVLAMIGILGFVTPGFFVTEVLDQAAVQNGVRSVLVNDYKLRNVGEIACPQDQQVLPARDFICTATVDNAPAQIRVVIRDSSGHYLVSRPN